MHRTSIGIQVAAEVTRSAPRDKVQETIARTVNNGRPLLQVVANLRFSQMLCRPAAIWGLLLASACLSGCGRPTKQASRDDAPTRVAALPSDGSVADAATPAGKAGSDPSVVAYLNGLEPKGSPPPPIKRRFRRGDCKTDYAPRPNRDPNPMCRVEGGTFMYGDGVYIESKTIDTDPIVVRHQAVKRTVGSFYIDQFEVTAAQAAHFLNARGNVCEGLDKKQNATDVLDCVWIESKYSDIEIRDGAYVAKKGQELVSERAFSWEGALQYCAWVGKQIPSSTQWEYAARHDPTTGRDLVFPWGDAWRAHIAACNAAPCEPNPGAGLDVRAPFSAGTFDGSRGRQDSSSPFGLHDTVGGGSEIVFECDGPDDTCKAGEPCTCRILMTPGDHSPDVDSLHVANRIDHTIFSGGLVTVRCVSRGADTR